VNPPHEPPSYDEADPFDLPAWLGESEVTWGTASGLASGHRVVGTLTAPGEEPIACDLLAVDEAYPEPVAGEGLRVRTHQAWRHGEVLVAADGPRVLLAVPGSRIDAETALEAVGRFARAVGAGPGSYAVRLRVGPEDG
jgi:hypothetical protein